MGWRPLKYGLPQSGDLIIVYNYCLDYWPRGFYQTIVKQCKGINVKWVSTELDRNLPHEIISPWCLVYEDNLMRGVAGFDTCMSAKLAKAWVVGTWEPGRNYGNEYKQNLPKIEYNLPV